MPKSDDWVTVAAWGRLHGLGRQGAAVAVRRCGIPKREDGKVESATATALYKAHTRVHIRRKAAQGAEQPPAAQGHVSFEEARRRQAVAQALIAERENARQAGELLPTQAVLERWQRILSDLRQRLLAIPSRAASEVPGGASKPQVHEVVERLLHDALHELAGEDGAPR